MLNKDETNREVKPHEKGHINVINKKFSFLIGISQYQNLPSLDTPEQDVISIGKLLKEKFGYKVSLKVNSTKNALQHFFEHQLPREVNSAPESSQVLIYFAGHGFAQDTKQGMKGYLIPSDAQSGDTSTWYSMSEMLSSIEKLKTRHLLLVLDCCFGGTFRFVSKYRAIGISSTNKLYKQHYHQYTSRPSWQVLTSTAPDQEALDFLDHGVENNNSPFAHLFIQGLKGSADLVPDRIITCAELFNYLKERLHIITASKGNPQNVGLFPLEKHQNGEYLFLLDGFQNELTELEYNNPYKGLNSYNPEDANLFFGRNQVIGTLSKHIGTHSFTVVTGASGSGKSSLVKAGIVPYFEKTDKRIKIIQPGKSPLSSIPITQDFDILIIDQFEQLITQASISEYQPFIDRIFDLFSLGKIIIITIRIDFESQIKLSSTNKTIWVNGKFIVPSFSTEELRQIIITPALRSGRFLEPPNLVDKIIQEVVHYPGSLPLLSFTMQQLFTQCKESPYRNITLKDYNELGGITGALQTSADLIYQSLEEKEQRTMQNIILRMVALSGGEIASQRILQSELNFVDEDENLRVKKILKVLQIERLILADTDHKGAIFYQASHDALIRSWDKPIRWINEKRKSNMLNFEEFSNGVTSYFNNEKSESILWDDDPRIQQIQLFSKSDFLLNKKEQSFLDKSLDLAIRKKKQFWRNLTLVISGLVALSATAIWFGFSAEKRRAQAEVNAVAFLAENLIDEGNATQGIQLLKYGYEKDPTNLNILSGLFKVGSGNSNLFKTLRTNQGSEQLIHHNKKLIYSIGEPSQIYQEDGKLIFELDEKYKLPDTYSLEYILNDKHQFWSEDGNFILMVDTTSQWYILNIELKTYTSIETKGDSLLWLSFSKDQESIYGLFGDYKNLGLWRKDGNLIEKILVSKDPIEKLELINNREALILSETGYLSRYSIKTGQRIEKKISLNDGNSFTVLNSKNIFFRNDQKMWILNQNLQTIIPCIQLINATF